MKENYLVYLKPGAVNWDNYLPILSNFKNNNIDIFLDDLNILSQFDINNYYHNIFFKIVNCYYIKIDSKIYRITKKNIIKVYNLVKYFSFRRNIYKQIYLKIISTLVKLNIVKIEVLKHKYFIMDINQIEHLNSIVDIKKIRKVFILRHGINIFDRKKTRNKSFITKLETKYIKKKRKYLLNNFQKKIFFFPYSNSEHIFYKENLKKLDFDHCIIGIPKHTKGWLVKSLSHIKPKKINKYILIISRPSNQNYFKNHIKIKSIGNIIKLAKNNHLNIVYKFHPKENTGVIKNRIKTLIKKFDFKKKFLFSEENTIYLAKHSLFNISFYSSVCLDMVNLGLCPVEYIETNKIKNSDYAKNNLTLFCNNEQKLKKIFDKIKINSKTINKNLKINYNSLFKKKISIAKIISIIKNEKS